MCNCMASLNYFSATLIIIFSISPIHQTIIPAVWYVVASYNVITNMDFLFLNSYQSSQTDLLRKMFMLI